MDKERAAIHFFLAGFALLAFGFAWPWMVGGKRAWTEDDAKAYTQASSELHDVQGRASHETGADNHPGHSHETNHEAPTADERKAAEERFAEIKAKRDAAMTRGRTVAFLAKILAGGLLAVGCVFRYLHNREET